MFYKSIYTKLQYQFYLLVKTIKSFTNNKPLHEYMSCSLKEYIKDVGSTCFRNWENFRDSSGFYLTTPC